MARWDDLANNPTFRALPREQQRAYVASKNSGFAALSPEAQTAWLWERVPAADDSAATKLGRPFLAGFQGSLASTEHMLSNAADAVRDWTGSETMGALSDHLAKRSKEMAARAGANSGEGIGAKLAEVAGALPVSLGTAAVAYQAGGPIVGFGLMGYTGARDRGTAEAVKRGVLDAAVGSTFPLTQHMGRAVRAAVSGGAAAAVSEQEGVDRAIEAATMGILAAVPGRAPSPTWADTLPPAMRQRHARATAAAGQQARAAAAEELDVQIPTEQTHPIGVWVSVTEPGGSTRYDFVRGTSTEHAIGRARARWPGAEIEAVDAPADAAGAPITATPRGTLETDQTPRDPRAPADPREEAVRLLDEEPAVPLGREGLPRELGERVIGEFDSISPEDHRLGSSGRALDDGNIEAWHVTDDPAPLYDVLQSHRELPDFDRGGFRELGRGLYVSGTPQLWTGRARGKWSFLRGLAQEQKDRLAEKLSRDSGVQSPYVTRSEAETASRMIEDWRTGKIHEESILEFAGQPYNVAFWKPEFLEPLGITPGKQPTVLPVEARGRFAEISGHLEEADVAALREAGYDGAYYKSGMATTPQLVIWNRHALRRVGEWKPDPIDTGIRYELDESGEPVGERAEVRESTEELPETVVPPEKAQTAEETWEARNVASAAGDSYVPMYDVHPSTEIPKKVVRKGDALHRFLKRLKMPVSFGYTDPRTRPGSKVAGYFTFGGEKRGKAHVKHWYDLQVTPHEAVHYLTTWYNDRQIRKQAGPAGPPEGTDRIVHLWRDPEIGRLTNMDWSVQGGGWFPRRSSLTREESNRIRVGDLGGVIKDRFTKANLPHMRELQDLSYDVKMTEEGAAEFMRIWMSQPAELAAPNAAGAPRAPAFTKLFENTLHSLSRGDREAFYELQGEITKWREAGALASAKGKIGIDKNTQDVMYGKLDTFRFGLSDKLQGVLNMARKTGSETDMENAYHAFRNLAGSSRIIEGMMEYGPIERFQDPVSGKMANRFTGKGGFDIWAPVSGNKAELERFGMWEIGKRSQRLFEQARDPKTGKVIPFEMLPAKKQVERGGYRESSREKTFTRNEIQSMLDAADDTMIDVPGQGQRRRKDVYEDVHQELMQFRDKILDFAESAGVLSPETRQLWLDFNPDFVFSYMRAFHEAKGGILPRNFLDQSMNVQGLRGSGRNLAKEPMLLWMDTNARMVRSALENIAKGKLVEVAKKGSFPGRFLEKVPPGAKFTHVTSDKLTDAVVARFKELTGLDMPKEIEQILRIRGSDPISLFMGNEKPHGDHILTYMRDGKPEYWEIRDPLLLKSLDALRSKEWGMPMSFLDSFRRFRQEVVTIDPAFTLANFQRDLVMSWVMRRHGGPHIRAALQAMKQRMQNDPNYRLAIANGMGGATLRGNRGFNARDVVKHAQRVGKDPAGYIDVMNPREWVRALQAFGRVVEEAPRLAEFNRARAEKQSPMRSSYAGREASTDFSMEGANDLVQVLNKVVPFLRATINGSDRFYRGVARDPDNKANTITKIVTALAVGGGLHAFNRAFFKDELDELPDWMKDNYAVAFLPRNLIGMENPAFPNDKNITLMMPLPWEPGRGIALLNRVTDSLLDSPDPFEAGLGKQFAYMLGANIGMRFGGEGMPVPLPIFMDSLIEQWANRVLFTGSPIVPASLEQIDAWKQVRAGQPKIFEKWGELMRDHPELPDVIRSPARVEALTRGIFGEIAMYAADAIDRVGLDPTGPSRGGPLRPLTRRNIRVDPVHRSVDEFYERLEMFREQLQVRRELEKSGEREFLKEFRADPERRTMAELAAPYDRVNRQIADLNRAIRFIERGRVLKDKTPDQKKDRILRIREDIARVTKKINAYAERRMTQAIEAAKRSQR